MSSPTAEEQLMLELMNRFRMAPAGELDRLLGADAQPTVLSAIAEFGTDIAEVRRQIASFKAVAPLAWNDQLSDAAAAHNDAMIAARAQSHQVAGEPPLKERATAAGYAWSRVGENTYAYVDDVIHGHAAYVIDWGRDAEDYDASGALRSDWSRIGDGILDGAGHRYNMMSTAVTEVGIAITHIGRNADGMGPLVTTQDIGTRADYKPQLMGVVIDDRDGDAFYDIGEGMGGVTVTLRNGDAVYTTTTWEAGGWQIAAPAGTYDITFSGGGLGGTLTETATLGRSNVKVDVAVSPHQQWPSQPEPAAEALIHDFSVAPEWDMMLF